MLTCTLCMKHGTDVLTHLHKDFTPSCCEEVGVDLYLCMR